MSAARTALTGRASAARFTRNTRPSWWPKVMLSRASAHPSAWIRCAPRRWPIRKLRVTTATVCIWDPAEAQRRVAAGESHVVRMQMPTEGVCQVPDMLRGTVEIPWDRMDMQVLMKVDGLPTYFLANVVDDHLMGIYSRVAR